MVGKPYTYFNCETKEPDKILNYAIYFVIGVEQRENCYKSMMVEAVKCLGEKRKETDFIEDKEEELNCFGYPTYKVERTEMEKWTSMTNGMVLAQRYFYNIGYRPHHPDPYVQIYDLWRMRSLYLIIVNGKVVSKMHMLHEEVFAFNESMMTMKVQVTDEELENYPPMVLERLKIVVEKPFIAMTVYGKDKEGNKDSDCVAIRTRNDAKK